MKYLSALTVLSCLALCHAKPLYGDAPTENGKAESQKDPCFNMYPWCHDAPSRGKNDDGIRKFRDAPKKSPKDRVLIADRQLLQYLAHNHDDAPNNGKDEDGIRKFVEAWKMSPKDLSDKPYSPLIYNRGIHHDAPNNGKNEDGIRKFVEAWKMSQEKSDAPTENGKAESQKDPCSNKFYIGCLGIHHDAPNKGKNEDGIRKFVEAWKMSPKDLSDKPYSPRIYNLGIHHDAPNNGKDEDGIKKFVEAWKMSPKDLFYIPYNGDAPNNRKMMTG